MGDRGAVGGVGGDLRRGLRADGHRAARGGRPGRGRRRRAALAGGARACAPPRPRRCWRRWAPTCAPSLQRHLIAAVRLHPRPRVDEQPARAARQPGARRRRDGGRAGRTRTRMARALLTPPPGSPRSGRPTSATCRLDERVVRVGVLRRAGRRRRAAGHRHPGAAQHRALVRHRRRARRSCWRSSPPTWPAPRSRCRCGGWPAWRRASTTATWIRAWTPRGWPAARSGCWPSPSTTCSIASPRRSRPSATSSPTPRTSCARR